MIWLILSAVSWMGCTHGQPAQKTITAEVQRETDKVVIYVYRNANYQGGGRAHMLQLDERTLGRLTNENYFYIELWPGNYYLNIHLPSETFFGQTNAPMSVGKQLKFTHRDAGKRYLYVYEDGGSLRREDASLETVSEITHSRSLTQALTADDTAHVKEFFDTAYEGPEMNGLPHGRGVLTWSDGSRYEGVFDHGQLTQEGRFYFQDGNVYMGRLSKGRPMGSGVLLDSRGHILYAGAFSDEKPQGTGLRRTEAGPEYCTFAEGVDVTPSFSYLAEVEVSAQDRREIMQFFVYCPYSLTSGADESFIQIYQAAYQAVLDILEVTRPLRLAKVLQRLNAEHQARINEERTWCREELSKDRRWCLCAPFDPQSGQWRSCIW